MSINQGTISVKATRQEDSVKMSKSQEKLYVKLTEILLLYVFVHPEQSPGDSLVFYVR